MSIDMSFESLLPGETRSETAQVRVPVRARLVDVVVEEVASEPGALAGQVELCPPSGTCLPVAPASEGAVLVAGVHDLEVSVTLADDAPARATSSITGRLVLRADEPELPPTGFAPALLGAAVVVLGAGLVLVTVSRRQVRRA